jgi:hypothetical protein
LSFGSGGDIVWSFNNSGHLVAALDNQRDIGAIGANRPRNVYVADSINATTSRLTSHLDLGSSAVVRLFCSANNTLRISNQAGTDFDRLQFGGTTASFPAIKRSTTYLQARLADDSAFAPIQGKLTTDTNYTATVVTPTGFLTLYDAQGTAYRVPCVLAP